MKTILTLSTLLILFCGKLMAQEDFTVGYYIINSGAKYSIAVPSSLDFSYDNSLDCFKIKARANLTMGVGEVVLAFEYSKGKVLCFDPNGRIIVFEDLNSLTKATITSSSCVGNMKETIDLIDGGKIPKGYYYWITGQNLANSTVTIQVSGGKTYEVPQSKININSVYIKGLINDETFIKVKEE
jgi:hypothetical protein